MSTTVATIHSHMPQISLGSIESYIAWVQKIPVLSPQEEKDLLHKVYALGDLSAARQLIHAHLRFVVYVSRSYMGYGLSQADIIQEGNIGLLKAAKKFDPEVGVRFSSFAVYWIKSEIQEFVLKNWRIVKIATTKAQRKMFFKMRRLVKNLKNLGAEEAQEVSQTLEVDIHEVWSMQERLHGQDHSYDGMDYEEGHDITKKSPLTLASPELGPEQAFLQSQSCQSQTRGLQAALRTLDERSLAIIKDRWLTTPKKTLHTLSQEYGISAERIRQIESLAIKKLKHFIQAPDTIEST